MTMKKGDVVYIEAESWAKETNELVWTTKKELAEKNDAVEEGFEYGPKALIVGAGRLIGGLEDSILKAELNKNYEFDIAPEDAYGEHDAKQVEVVSIDQIRRLPEYREKGEDGSRKFPDVGDEFFFRNKVARIVWMSASRVRIDFNHPLAGKTLHYKYKVIKKASKAQEKVEAILVADFKKGGDFQVKLTEKSAEITLPDWCRYDQDWFSVKFKVVSDLREHAGIEEVKFIEEYKKPKAKKASKKDDDKPEKEKEKKDTKTKSSKSTAKKSTKSSKRK